MESRALGMAGLRLLTGGGSFISRAAKTSAVLRPPNGGLPGRHLVQHAAQAEEVGAGVERVALGLLGRHVGSGADGRAGGGEIHHPSGRGAGGIVLRVKVAGIGRGFQRPVSWPGRNREF
jgi:hypothetical protein